MKEGFLKKSIISVIIIIFVSFTACSNIDTITEESIIQELEKAGAYDCEKIDITKWEQEFKELGNPQIIREFSLYRFIYKSDDLNIEGYISIPLHILNEKKDQPCIIYNHGGNRDLGALNGKETVLWAYKLDMVCIASNFRGCGKSDGMDNFGGEDINDVIHLIDICEKSGFIDKKQINMLGASRGGMMTYGTLREDDRIHRAVVTGGLTDAFMVYEDRDDMKIIFETLLGGSPSEIPEEYERRSAVYWANEINTPLLIIHAVHDARSNYIQVENFVEELEHYNKNYTLITYNDDLHAGVHDEDLEFLRDWLLKK